ncbi:Pr6Pr family membrane protein [Cellulomonas dongxiuzhuiae]|uniref:Pr6Pr family membrane protein n=1 Tax=Cellulomonas dongxiuzhuiae TaxID=2819979 RepID=UPI0020374643|nr:Pr6Pr family membrane protein [Cellulomonas dongxiuzhuiae]
MTDLPTPATARVVGVLRLVVAVAVLVVLAVSYAEQRAAGRGALVDFLGYFTNLTSLLASVVLLVTGTLLVAGRPVGAGLTVARGVAAACLVVVAVVYNFLVPGEGGATAWVSAVLHLGFPCVAALDWLLVADRPPLPWRRLWVVLPYPLAWLGVVLVRGAADGWVPYGFLLPERGAGSVTLHVLGLVVVLVAAGALVWAASRVRRLPRRRAAPADA